MLRNPTIGNKQWFADLANASNGGGTVYRLRPAQSQYTRDLGRGAYLYATFESEELAELWSASNRKAGAVGLA